MSAKLVVMVPKGNQTRERQVKATLLQEPWMLGQHATVSSPYVAILLLNALRYSLI